MYKVINTDDGYMVEDHYDGTYVHDENGDNCFYTIEEAQKMLYIARVRDAIDAIYIAVKEGDAEAIAHLAIRYKQLFGTKEKTNE